MPASRWSVADVISAFIRARAIGLSLTSTKPTCPDAWIARAVSISPSSEPPFGGSSSTETTHSPSRRARARPLSLSRCGGAATRSGSSTSIVARRGPARVERLADGLDLRGRRPAAAAHDPCAEPDRLHGELGEVVGGRVGVHDAAARQAREADVRQRGERKPGAAHAAKGPERDRRPGAVIRPDRRDVERREPAGRGLGADAARDLRVVVERQERDDREGGDAAHRLDGDDQLLEVEERLDHEEVDAAPLEHLRLRRVERAVLGRVEHLELAERADRPCDEDVAARDLARLAGEPHAGGVDLLERVVEEDARELAPVRAERVRLDQLGARGDVARVDGDHALGRAEVRLLGAAEPRNGAGDERARAAVGDERRARCAGGRGSGSRPATVEAGVGTESGEAGLPPRPAPTRPGSFDRSRPPSRPSGVR